MSSSTWNYFHDLDDIDLQAPGGRDGQAGPGLCHQVNTSVDDQHDPILSICNQLSLLCEDFSFLVRWIIIILAEICTIRYPMETSPHGRCIFRYSGHLRLQLKFKPIQTITLILLCVLLSSNSVLLYFLFCLSFLSFQHLCCFRWWPLKRLKIGSSTPSIWPRWDKWQD